MKTQTYGSGGPLLILAGEDGREVFDRTREKTDKPFTLISFQTEDWMGDYSPWQAEGFAGNGKKTLDSVKELLRGYETVPAAICGYSLAGLFALWAFYETGLFKGAVSCSGSLWFEGFMDYLKASTAPGNSFVYLSLGGKEEKTDHPVMKTIGDRTRETSKLLQKDPNIVDTTLVMNKGGHFGDAVGRLALGCGWMVERLYKEIPQDSARTANLLPSPQGKVPPQAADEEHLFRG